METGDSSLNEKPTADAPQKSIWRQNQALLIVLPFILVALLIVVTQYDSYQIARYNQLYTFALAEGRPGDAVKPLRELIARTAPNNADARRKLATAYIEMGDHENALKELESLKADHAGTDLDEPLMISYYELATRDKGSRDPDALTKKSPAELEAAAKSGSPTGLDEPMMVAHFELGDSQEGRRHLDALLAKNPLDPAANYYLARELIKEGKYSEAGQALRVAGTDAKWDKRAEPVRKELAAKVFGPGNEEGDLVLPADMATSPTQVLEAAPATSPVVTNDAATSPVATNDAATSQ